MAKSFDNDKTIYSSFNEEEITSASQELIKNLPAEETKKTDRFWFSPKSADYR